MGFDRAMKISLSGLEAERLAMELIASNLANINTTRSVLGGPYHRRAAILSEKPLSFSDELDKAEYNLGGGVEVAEVKEDNSALPKVYNPSHPDADAHGFVTMPNVNYSHEMVDMVDVSRLYQANITAFNATKKMMQDTMQLP